MLSDNIIKINFLNTIPNEFDENSIYFIKDNNSNNFVNVYITGNNKDEVRKILDLNDVITLIQQYIQSIGAYDIYIVNSYSDLNNFSNIDKPFLVYVKNDTTNNQNLNIPYSLYIYDNENNQFIKIYPNNFGNISIEWNNILNKPSATVYDIDYSVIRFNPIVSNYYVVSSLPSNPENGSLYYNMSNNKLFKFIDNRYFEINWLKEITNTDDYKNNKLRINNFGDLEITPNNTNWYRVYPLVGANTFNIKTLDNNSFSFIYYLPIGYSVILNNVNHIPLTFIQGTYYTGKFYIRDASTTDGFLFPSNVSVSGTYTGIHLNDNSISSVNNTTTGLRLFISLSTNISQFRRELIGGFDLSNNTNLIASFSYYRVSVNTYGKRIDNSYTQSSQSFWWVGTFRNSTSPYNIINPNINNIYITRVF